MLRAPALALALLPLLACGDPRAPAESPPACAPCPACPAQASAPAAPADMPTCDESERGLSGFAHAPSGIPEVTAPWLHANYCKVRVIDVREADELTQDPGHIPGVEWIPASRLQAASDAWDPETPLVLVCRSGRRSARTATLLEAAGFRKVAALTGGMIAWSLYDLPLSHGPDFVDTTHATPSPAASATPPPLGAHRVYDRAAIAEHIGDPAALRWTKAAALLLAGTEACVDGRDEAAVFGTPGGDAGELLLTLAVKEQFGEVLDDHRIDLLLDAYLDAFGSFYIHTDRHALEHLRQALVADPRFAGERPLLVDVSATERYLRAPPVALREALLGHLVDPANVGCGHLRLILQHPDEYGVRPDLAAAFLRAVFRARWRGAAIDYVVLSGEHHEGAIIRVAQDGEVEPFTRVPAIAPHRGASQVFVAHPQVARFCREQNARFLLQRDEWLRAHGIDEAAFLRAQAALADRQLAATLGHLAPGLPLFEARFRGAELEVLGPLGE